VHFKTVLCRFLLEKKKGYEKDSTKEMNTIQYPGNSSLFSDDLGSKVAKGDYITLGGKNLAAVDQMLAHLGASGVGSSDYFSLAGKRTAAELRKPKNVTPPLPRPYCRIKEF
jgi:hypothetical protein